MPRKKAAPVVQMSEEAVALAEARQLALRQCVKSGQASAGPPSRLARLAPGPALEACSGADVVRSAAARKGRILISLPGVLLPAKAGVIGHISGLNSGDPVLELPTADGTVMRMHGVLVRPSATVLSLQCDASKRSVACTDAFQAIIAFTSVRGAPEGGSPPSGTWPAASVIAGDHMGCGAPFEAKLAAQTAMADEVPGASSEPQGVRGRRGRAVPWVGVRNGEKDVEGEDGEGGHRRAAKRSRGGSDGEALFEVETSFGGAPKAPAGEEEVVAGAGESPARRPRYGLSRGTREAVEALGGGSDSDSDGGDGGSDEGQEEGGDDSGDEDDEGDEGNDEAGAEAAPRPAARKAAPKARSGSSEGSDAESEGDDDEAVSASSDGESVFED